MDATAALVPAQIPGNFQSQHYLLTVCFSMFSAIFCLQTSYELGFRWLFPLFLRRLTRCSSWAQVEMGSALTYLVIIFPIPILKFQMTRLGCKYVGIIKPLRCLPWSRNGMWWQHLIIYFGSNVRRQICHVSFIDVPENLSHFSPITPSHLSSVYCQFVLNFNVS